jgi:hypothetical protein
VNGDISGSTTTSGANGAQLATSTGGTLITNGNVYGNGNLVQSGTSPSASGIYANGGTSSVVIVQGGTVFGGPNSVGVSHQTGTLRVYSHLKGGNAAAVSLSRTTATTVEIGTPANPVTIASSDRPYGGAGLRVEAAAVSNTVNIHCSGLSSLGTNAINTVGGSSFTITLTLYGGATVKPTYAGCINIGSGSTSASSFTINGNVYGSDSGNTVLAVNVSSPITLTVNGDVYGGQSLTGFANHGINIAINIAATIIVNGTAYAGNSNSSSGIYKVVSTATGATMYVRKAVGNAYGDWVYTGNAPTAVNGGFGVDNADPYTTCTIGSLVSGAYGAMPTRGFHRLSPTVNGVTVPCYNQRRESPNGSTSTTISYSLGIGSSTYMPAAADVQSAFTYGVTASPTTGTMVVPSASDVYYGVPVGSTTGTAYATPADILNYPVSSVTAGSIGERVARSLTCEELAAILAAQPN